jgi:hypothetical protein
MRRTLRTMLEGFMFIPNIIKEMNLALIREQSGSNRMNGRISPSLVVETAFRIEVFEKLHVCFASPEIEIADFEIGPEVAFVVGFAAVV